MCFAERFGEMFVVVKATASLPHSKGLVQIQRDGGSGIICGSGEAAGGHRSRDWRIRAPEEERAKFYGVVPVSWGEDAVVCGAPGEADFSLLRLRQGRRRIQLRDGDGEVPVS